MITLRDRQVDIEGLPIALISPQVTVSCMGRISVTLEWGHRQVDTLFSEELASALWDAYQHQDSYTVRTRAALVSAIRQWRELDEAQAPSCLIRCLRCFCGPNEPPEIKSLRELDLGSDFQEVPQIHVIRRQTGEYSPLNQSSHTYQASCDSSE